MFESIKMNYYIVDVSPQKLYKMQQSGLGLILSVLAIVICTIG